MIYTPITKEEYEAIDKPEVPGILFGMLGMVKILRLGDGFITELAIHGHIDRYEIVSWHASTDFSAITRDSVRKCW